MDVKVSIGEEVGMNTPIKVEFRKDKGGASLNNASATERSAEQQYPATVYEAARNLADAIKRANVEVINSTIGTLARRDDSSAVFNFRRLSRGSLLHIAAATGRSSIVSLLLDHVNADLIAARDDWGNTPLHLATKKKATDVINILICRAEGLPDLEDRLLLRKKNNYGNTALHEAVLACNNHGITALPEAVLTCEVDLVSHLLGKDLEPVYWKNKDLKSPLYLAIDIGNSQILELLLSKSLNPSKIQGLPPALGAVARKEYDLLGKILRKDTKLFAMRDSRGGNVFHLAAFWNVPEVFRFLQLETEYLAQEHDNNGDLPIHIASKRGHVELIHKLHPVSKWVNGKGQTVLHVAAKYGREEVVRYVLKDRDLRLMINERDDDGNTASHLAVKYLHLTALIHLVLDEDLDPYLLNHEGLAAVDIAGLSSQAGLRRGLARILLSSVSNDRTDRFISKPEARDKWPAHGNLPNRKEMDDRINTLLVVATLVSTVSFTAGFAVPGGWNSSDLASKDDRGMATLLDNIKFQAFVICNTVAMLCSMASVIGFMFAYMTEIHISIFGCHIAGLLLAISLPPMSAAFLIGVISTIEKLPWLAIAMVILGSIFVLVITAALVSPFVAIFLSWLPLFRNHLGPIRPLISSLFRVYMILFRIERTFISDHSQVHRTAS